MANNQPIKEKAPIFTIGHSNHKLEKFLAMLKAHGIELLADVRTMPRSRYNPQYNASALAASLKVEDIAYLSMKALGGMRKPMKGSINLGWKNTSFRGYADYMQTQDFALALEALIHRAAQFRTVIMCAESVPWRCHRSLIADALIARHIPVCHILSQSSVKPHQVTEFAHIKGREVTYPLPKDLLSNL